MTALTVQRVEAGRIESAQSGLYIFGGSLGYALGQEHGMAVVSGIVTLVSLFR